MVGVVHLSKLPFDRLLPVRFHALYATVFKLSTIPLLRRASATKVGVG